MNLSKSSIGSSVGEGHGRDGALTEPVSGVYHSAAVEVRPEEPVRGCLGALFLIGDTRNGSG